MILHISAGVYAALYFAGIVSSLAAGEITFQNLEGVLFILLFLLFIVAFALSWTRERLSGIVFMLWNAGVWIYALFLFRESDSAMFCIIAVPVLVIGSLLLLRWYKTTREPAPSDQQKWKFILRVLLINYAVLYAITIVSELASGKSFAYLSLPFLLLPLLLLTFIAGFLLSWKNELYAGLIFLLWYVVIIFGNVAYAEFLDSGPWIIFGVPILLHGIFYIKNHFKFKGLKYS